MTIISSSFFPAVVTLSIPNVSNISEGSGSVLICLSLLSLEETERSVRANVRTLDGVALGNINFTSYFLTANVIFF